MVRTYLLLAATGLACAAHSAAAAADHWISVANSTTADVIDVSTMKQVGCKVAAGQLGSCRYVIRPGPYEEHLVQAWTTRIHRPLKGSGTIAYQKMLQEFDCGDRTVTTLAIYDYSAGGDALDRMERRGDPSHAVPGSMGEGSLDFVCSASNLDESLHIGSRDPVPAAEALIRELRAKREAVK